MNLLYDNYVFEHQTKEDHKRAIINMLESLGYELSNRKSYNKLKRMKKNQLKELYSLIRYQTNTEHITNDLLMIYGIIINEL